MSSSESKQAFLVSIQRTQGQRLRRFLSARLRNAAADAPDLMQEVFLRLLRIHDHETIRNPQAYLFTVASHVLHQHTLRQAVTSDSEALLDLATDLQQLAESNPAEEVESEQFFEALGDSLKQISPRAYMTLVWSRRDGLSLQEIAVRLGVSRDQVKKYLARALIHIRQGLQDRG